MASQSWWQDLAGITTAGTLYNTFTTAKSLLTSATATAASDGATILPPNFFRIGGMIQVEAIIAISNIVTTPGTMNFQVVVGGVAAFDTGNIILTTTAHTTIPLYFKALLTCRAVGNGTLTTLMGQAQVNGQMIQQSGAAAADTVGGSSAIYPNAVPAVGTGFNNTAANSLDFFGGFSISNAGNGMQVQQYSVTSRGNSAP
jgi:hypothetical protein